MQDYDNILATSSTAAGLWTIPLSTTTTNIVGSAINNTITNSEICTDSYSYTTISDSLRKMAGLFGEEREDDNEMKFSDDTRTILNVDGKNMTVSRTRNHRTESTNIMPAIIDVRVFNDSESNPCVTRVDFADGTHTTAVRQAGDEFNLEQGISICITKKLLDGLVNGEGGQIYNKLIRKACKIMRDNRKADAELHEAEQAAKRRYEKLVAKRKKKADRQKEKAKEEIIEIYKEAYLRAMNEHDAK